MVNKRKLPPGDKKQTFNFYATPNQMQAYCEHLGTTVADFTASIENAIQNNYIVQQAKKIQQNEK